MVIGCNHGGERDVAIATAIGELIKGLEKIVKHGQEPENPMLVRITKKETTYELNLEGVTKTAFLILDRLKSDKTKDDETKGDPGEPNMSDYAAWPTDSDGKVDEFFLGVVVQDLLRQVRSDSGISPAMRIVKLMDLVNSGAVPEKHRAQVLQEIRNVLGDTSSTVVAVQPITPQQSKPTEGPAS